MSQMIGALCVVLAVGCVAPEAEHVGEVEQHGRCVSGDEGEYECDTDCTGCGHNGLRESSWTAGGFNRPTFQSFGLWVHSGPGVLPGVRSLCDPAQVYPDHCVMRAGYSQWIAANWSRRVDVMTHVVAAIAETNFHVEDPVNGRTYWGSFNLRPEALTKTWDHKIQETVTAALLAQLNSVPGVAICMLNAQRPMSCDAEGGEYHEAAFFGNMFQVPYFAAISGGADAPDPTQNLRYGTVYQSLEYPPVTYHYDEKRCIYEGAGSNLHATRCEGEGGVLWNHPVTIRTPGSPGDWYYGGCWPRPNSFPLVPIDY